MKSFGGLVPAFLDPPFACGLNEVTFGDERVRFRIDDGPSDLKLDSPLRQMPQNRKRQL
jgi:hypothetical protein